MATKYTLITVDVSGFLTNEKDKNYHSVKDRITSALDELAESGWRIVGQSVLPGEPARILYTLEKS